MNTHLYFMLLTFAIMNIIYAQPETISEKKLIQSDTIEVNPELPGYIINVYANKEDLPESLVKVFVIGDTTLYQSFSLESGHIVTKEEGLKDINFDGYNDLEVFGFWRNTINTASSFWLFNPDKKIFEESEEFSEFDEIEVDNKNQIISSWAATTGNDKSSLVFCL